MQNDRGEKNRYFPHNAMDLFIEIFFMVSYGLKPTLKASLRYIFQGY